ncbi:MAG: hydantoinase/oxoprolinase family protein [Dongiaceae bacterium]
MKRVGIDVGGTFTDVVLLDDESGQMWTTKVLTTPRDRVVGTIEGFHKILQLSGCRGSDIGFLGHGTTMATNMIVEGKGARTALVTTRGFRDILELRRVSRHDRADLYDLLFENPVPLVPRRWRLEMNERLRFDGTVETPLDVAAVRDIAKAVAPSDIEAVAVSFLHAYANPAHEIEAVAELRRLLPDRFICASHEINPEIMEYERTSSTVINAMLGPVCGQYIVRLSEALKRLGFAGTFLFMQSNGGLANPAIVAERPIIILESGPAGGVSAAIRNCRNSEVPNAILGDMGGTTFDVSIIRGFRPELRNRNMLRTYAVRSPMIDIDSIGAGGGSIAWIDAAGGVQIGPESAGADPGPACYGRGGSEATVTDCNLVLGYIDPDSYLGGEFQLDRDAAVKAVETRLARPLGVGLEQAAQVVRRVANARMAQAIRIMTVERGHDPREFSYICYGGAGPLHALEIAAEMGIRQVIVPPLPGLFSAFGVTVADQQYDFQAPMNETLTQLSHDNIMAAFRGLEERARATLVSASIDPQLAVTSRRVDCRYAGQPDDIVIDLSETRDACAAIRDEFEVTHKRLWNFTSPGKTIVLSNVRIEVVASTGWKGLFKINGVPASTSQPHGKRTVCFEEGRQTLPVFRRSTMSVGTKVKGPAVIEEHSSCVVLRPSCSALVDKDYNLVIEVA